MPGILAKTEFEGHSTRAHNLLPCPFCGAGATHFTENGKIWLGMRYSEPSSVSVIHWCPEFEGEPSRRFERVGRDEESAIAAWNRRAALPPSDTAQAPIDYDRVVQICEAHGFGLPVDCVEMVVEIIRHAAPVAPTAQKVAENTQEVARGDERAAFDDEARSADRIARTLSRQPTAKVKAIYEKLARAYTVPSDGEVAKQYYVLGFIDGERSITDAPARAASPQATVKGDKPVAFTSPDRLAKIAKNPAHVDTLWGKALTNEGENIALYTRAAVSQAGATANLMAALRELLECVELENTGGVDEDRIDEAIESARRALTHPADKAGGVP
ncbi:Lar family restriction alleviation protein [Paraburkholderia youngii]|uniref:Lar family restriction alleviation protein n=1 Tax=Paraburkholderia youngii TaxID=2782701 RepID=UPI003D1BFB5F